MKQTDTSQELIKFIMDFAQEAVNRTAICGGGGKTSLMYSIGQELAKNRKVLLSTTTKIYAPRKEQCADLIVGDVGYCISAVGKSEAPITTAAQCRLGSKLKGFDTSEIEQICRSDIVEAVICECDGSRGLPLKFYEEWEPPVPQSFTLFIAVTSADVFGSAITEGNVLRADKFIALYNLPQGAIITRDVYFNYLTSRNAVLKNAPCNAKKILIFNKCDNITYNVLLQLETIAPKLLDFYDAVLFASIAQNRIYAKK